MIVRASGFADFSSRTTSVGRAGALASAGQRRRVNVPFLELWKGPVTGPTVRCRIGMPPLARGGRLGGAASNDPGRRASGNSSRGGGNKTPVIIVVDRGLTMSVGKPPRFAALAEELKPVLHEQFGDAPVRLVSVPGGETITAIDTRDLLEPAVRQQLQLNPASPVIVLSDQELHLSNERMVCIAPQTESSNISIARIAARISPAGQVMVTLRNQSHAKKMELQVQSDNRPTAAQEVDLPPKGTTRDYFLPIDAAARQIRAQIEGVDDFTGDNTAYLVRRGSWPTIEPRTPLFAELQRLIEKYSRLRPPGESIKRVALVSPQDAGADPQIILANIGIPRQAK